MTTTKWTWVQEPYPAARFNEKGCLQVWGGDALKESPPVLSMWLETAKFIAKKSKSAGLTQEIGFSAPNSCTLPWLVKGATQLCTFKKEWNELDMTVAQYFWLIDRNDWSSWFAISSSHVCAVPVKVFLVGLPQKKKS
jgi:hypothetical protein